MRMREKCCRAVAALLLLGVAVAQGRADVVIYSTPDANGVGELVPNANDGTPNRPNGDQMGNTVIFAAGPRYLDAVTVQWGTYNFSGSSPAQNITLSLYAPNGPADLTGPGTNGDQPGTLIASDTIAGYTHFEYGLTTGTLGFQFNGLAIPNSVVAIVSSSYIGSASNQTGWIPSSDFTPVVGSNPNGDRAWYGTSTPGSFSSDNTWAFNDGGSPSPNSISNNLMFTFFASTVPEPSSVALSVFGFVGLVVCGVRRRRKA